MIGLGALAALLLLWHGGRADAAEHLVADQAAYREAVAALQPGDSVVLADGVWRDFEILFTGEGKAGQPITLRAQTQGGVILSGQSNLRLAGRHLVVSGLVFRDGHTPSRTVIAFRAGKGRLAHDSRVTQVVIDGFNNPERYETDFWVMMYGKGNRFDHSHLSGKRNQGVTLAVRLDSEESRENRHRIDHNYFGPRQILGANGGETLRIGTSHHSLSKSLTLVESNYFDRCNGELEIISSKSGGNVFRGNLFRASRGTLTLRHGHGALVEGNVFLGERAPHTGGIRVINRRQWVRGNYLQGLTGRRFGGALVVMNGVPNSPPNRYDPVEGAMIESNSIIGSDHIELGAGKDAERSKPPLDSAFRKNLIYNEDAPDAIAVHDDLSGIFFVGNLLAEGVAPPAAEGFEQRRLALAPDADGLLRPVDPALGHIGAPPGLRPLDPSATGVSWYPKPGRGERFGTGKTIPVQPGEDSLNAAIRKAGPGDVLELAPGDYLSTRTAIIDKPLTLSAAQRQRARLAFERTALFEIVEGGSLRLDGVVITGEAAPDVPGNAAIRTSRYSMLGNYMLLVENSRIENLDKNHSFSFFMVAKHTFADRIVIAGSDFQSITGPVLALNRELDDLGIYNAEYVAITGSSFRDLGGALADLYRGGTDESTFGPHFELSDSTLENVGQGRRNKSGASVRLHGVQDALIQNNQFINSAPVRVVQTVGDPVTRIASNRFTGTEEPQVQDIQDIQDI